MLHCKIGESVQLGFDVNFAIVCVLRLNTDDSVNGIACNQLGRRGLVERVCPRNVVIQVAIFTVVGCAKPAPT